MATTSFPPTIVTIRQITQQWNFFSLHILGAIEVADMIKIPSELCFFFKLSAAKFCIELIEIWGEQF